MQRINNSVRCLLFPLAVISIWFLLFSCGEANSEDNVLKATHADDMWYPSSARKLAETVDNYIANAEYEPTGEIVGLISPHAGYRFCGQVMGSAYRQIKGMKFDTVVLVGPSHNYGFSGVCLYKGGVFRNPLGDVKIDSELADELMKQNQNIGFDPRPHIPEHSLENQIPFLQRTLKDFKILPILMQDSSKQNCDMLSSALANVLKGKNVLLVASTDMTHYPTYDEAVKADKYTMSVLKAMDPIVMRKRLDDYMKKGIKELHCMLCGDGPVYVVMDTAKKLGADSVKILKYANSGDVPEGSKDRVVGYMAVEFFKSEQKKGNPSMDSPLNNEQQETLLKLARDTIEQYLRTGERKVFETDDPRMKVKQGVFVTLRKGGNLRGCIGYIIPTEPLYNAVIDMAIASSTDDPRFQRVTIDEMKSIEIEISVLSIPRKVKNADEIEMGKHGVIVTRGMRKGVFLPQVAAETGWDRVTFLEHLCRDKAGLSKDAWKDPDTTLEVFTAQLFEEEK